MNTNNEVSENQLVSSVHQFLLNKYGEQMTQEMVSEATQMQRSAISILSEQELPKKKAGASRVARVEYQAKDVAAFIIKRKLNHHG